MNRRGFFGAMAAAIAGATLDPERLLWEPGKKLISIPQPQMVWIHHAKINPESRLWFTVVETVTMEQFRRRYPVAARAYDSPEKYAGNCDLFSSPPARKFAFHRDAFALTSERTPAR